MTEIDTVEGEVELKLVGDYREETLLSGKHNLATYGSSEALAAAYAGDSSYMPSKIAFLYSDDATVFTNLNGLTRDMTWEDVSNGASFVITNFSYAPSIVGQDVMVGQQELQTTVSLKNKVVFHARTQGIPDNSIVYRACLLGKSDDAQYRLLAIVDLATEDDYRAKPEGFELSIDWAIKFN